MCKKNNFYEIQLLKYTRTDFVLRSVFSRGFFPRFFLSGFINFSRSRSRFDRPLGDVSYTYNNPGPSVTFVSTGKIQTGVPDQTAALPAGPVRQVEHEPRAVRLGPVHHAVGMEEGLLDAHQPDEPERDGGGLAEEGRAGDVRLQVGQDHAGQVRQPFGPRGAVPLNAVISGGVARRRRSFRPARQTGPTKGARIHGKFFAFDHRPRTVSVRRSGRAFEILYKIYLCTIYDTM